MKKRTVLKTCLVGFACILLNTTRAQNVFDTYNPWSANVDSIVTTYSFNNAVPNYIGEYQLFTNGLTAWQYNVLPTGSYSISYKLEPVSFPFVPDCSSGDCGNASSTTRNMIMPDSLTNGAYVFWKPFLSAADTFGMNTTSEPSELLSNAFTQTGPLVGTRDLLPHTILKHTYYLHDGGTMNDPIIDSFSFVLDHTRGLMSRYPFTANNGDSDESEHDISIVPWIIYTDADSFHQIPVQSSNFMNSVNYFPYPATGYPSFVTSNPSFTPGMSDIHESPEYYIHPSPYSLLGVMLGNAHLGTFAGSQDTVLMAGCSHTYYIDTALDFRKINPDERIIYNPTRVFITATTPVVFPSGYTFMTVSGKYPSASQVTALDPNNMYGDLRNVPITGTALNLTNNIHTSASDGISLYEVTSGCTLRIESCVTINDCKITVDSGAVIEFDSSTVFGNWSLTLNPGSTQIQLSNDPNVPCKYMCYEESNYNERLVHVTTNQTWDTANIETNFPGTALWSAAQNNTARFVEGIVIDSGKTLTVNAGVNLEFGPNARVIVKRGGRLVVNGTSGDSVHFRSACQLEWKGIEVWGDPIATQQTTSGYTLQGYVDAEYCVFEHARNGIVAGCLDSSGAEGGVIDVDRCSFLNNVRDIVLLPYRNYAVNSVTTTASNRSQITRSAFRTTEQFFNPALNETSTARPQAASAHISFYGVNFSTIQDCIFSTANSLNYNPHLRGTGIYSMESGFYLRTQFPCTFENLSDGIVVQSSGVDTKVVNVAGATFTNNIHGIVLEGTRFSAVMKNEFDVPESPEFGYTADELEKGYDKPVGVFIIGCVDYNVWENEFNVGDTASQVTPVTNCDNCCYDIVVYNSVNPDSLQPYYGIGTGKIYKNKIHHAIIGIQAQGDNGQWLNPNGLEVACNEFDELVNYDFAAVGRNGMNPVVTTLRDQGDCTSDPNLLATNFFLGSCSGQEQVNANTNATTFNYVDDTNQPQCVNIPLPGCGGLGSNSCPSYLNWGWYQPIISVKYNTASTNHQDARHDLDSLIDDGDTENFLNKILQSEGDALYSDLSDASPWLSDIVLLTLLDNENRDKLSEEQLVDILIQNGRLSETVYAAMLISEPVLSDESYRVLEENQAIVGVRELKEREWKAWMFQADLVAAELVTHALTNDSLDGAIAVLDGTTALPEMQKLFVLYLADQDTANAELELIDIVNAQQGKDNVWSAMAWVALDHAQEGRSWLNATLGEFELADSIWNANPEKEIGARSVVAYYRPRRFAREPFALESGERHGNTDEATSTPIVILPSLQLYPNPATNTVSVVVSGNSDTEMRLEVLNALGQKVDEIVIASGIQTEIDISGYASGMLYLRLTSQGIGLATEKLMIVR